MTQQERDEIRALVMSFSTRISDLPEVQSLSDADYITVVQDDGSKKHSKKATFQALLQLLKIHYPDNNGAKYQGVAHPTDQNVALPIGTDGFWFAIDAGIYTNYGGITVGNCPKVIRYDVVSHEWSSDDLWGDINGTIGFRLKPGVTPNSLDTFRIPVRPNGSYLINVDSLPAGALGSTVISEFDYDGNLLKRTELESLPLDFIPQTGTDYIQVTLGYNSSNPIDIEHSEVTMSSSVKVLIEGLYNFIVDVLQGEYEAKFDNIENDITNILSRLSAAETAIQQLHTDVEGIRDDIDGLSSRIDGIDGQIGDLNTGLNTLNTKLQETIDNTQLAIDGISTRLEDDEGYISELQLTARLFQVRLSDAEGNISTLRQTAEEISAQVENAQGDIALLYIRADEIGTRVTNAEGDISTLTQRADEITAQVQNAQGDIATLQITATQISSTVQNMQGDMSVLEQTAQQISARVTNVEGDVSELYITADEIGTRVTDAEGNISTLTQTSTALTARLEDAEGDITALEVTANGLSTRITNTEGDISTLQLTASSLESRIENAEGDISTLTQTAEGISARVSNAENDISELNITAGEISARVSDAEDNISALTIRADGIEARVSDNEDNIASLELTAEGLTTRVSNAEGNISTLQQTATSLTSRITDAEGDISTLEQTATSLTSRISTAEGNITTINQDIDSIELSVSTISTNLTNYEALTDAALSNLQDQIDGVIQTWYAEGVPTLSNYPANEWDADEKPNHIGDLYYDKLTGKAYRFMLDGSQEPPVYVWTLIADEDVAKALALAGEKKRVFVTTPYAPYDVGDLWVKERTVNNTTTREIYKCVTSRAVGDTINLNTDWVSADDYGYQVNKANLEVLTDKIVGKVTQITYNQDGTISSQSASLIEQNANEIKLQVANGAIDDALDSGGSINSALLPTGIDITNEKVVITANHFYLKGNNVGSDAALVLVYKDNVPKISVVNLDVTGVFQTNEWSTQVTNLNTTAQGYANTAESNANSYADGVGASTLDDAKDYSDDNLQLAKDYADNIETSAINTAEDYFNTIVYGNGGTAEHPTSGSILYTINNLGDEYTTLNNQINVGNNSLVSQINTLSGHLTDMGYLAEALLNGRTVIGGGLILSSLIQLGSNPGGQNWQVWSGINGVYDSSAYGNGIAAWYGGAMLDRHYSGNTDTNRAARSLFRFDGSGYLANQKIRWDYDNNDVKLVIDGYVLTHEVQLGYTDQSDVWHTMAGISGSYDATDAANGYGIAAWYGGEKIDRKKTPSATNGATSLFRFDGSGYLANRQIEWGASGELIIHGQSTENPITIENAVLTQGNLSVTISDLLKLKSWFVEEEYTIPGDSTIHHRLKLVGSTTGIEGLHVEGHILSDNDQIVGSGTPGGGGGSGTVPYSTDLLDFIQNLTPSAGKMLIWTASGTNNAGTTGGWTLIDKSSVGVTTNASQSAAGLMSSADKIKLDAIEAQANKYVLPIASASVLGGIKVGSGLSINASTGVLDATYTYTLPLAANGTRGGIQIGYSSSGKNYAVQLSSEKAYVNVPWTDTTYKLTLNGTVKGTTGGTDLGSFYAPAGGGTANQVLIAGGNNTAPSWTNQSNLSVGTASKLGSATVGSNAMPIYLNAGTPTAITSFPEAYLSWGGKNLTGTYGPIDAAMINDLGANRLAFSSADQITILYSTDGGTTWLDYGATDAAKIGLVSGIVQDFRTGKNSTVGAHTTDHLLRVIYKTSASRVLYTVLNKYALDVTCANQGSQWVTIEGRNKIDVDNDNDNWTVFAEKVPISGWSGWNIVNTSNRTIGGSYFTQIRFTIGMSVAGGTNTWGVTLRRLFGFGGVGWTTPSNMARSGHLYEWDATQNATFPAGIYPKNNATWNLGNSSLRWLTIYAKDANFSGTGTISGNTTIGGTLTVGTASANKATTLNGTLSATGNTTIGGTLTVGTSSAKRATTLNGSLEVSSRAKISGVGKKISEINAIANDAGAWNQDNNSTLSFVESNNRMAFTVDRESNGRRAFIQVGHNETNYANYLGKLFLNPYGGNVGVGSLSADYKLHVTGTFGVTGATTLSSTLAVTGLATLSGGATIPSGKTLKIGDATIEWVANSGNGYLKIDKPLLTTGDQIVGSGTPSGGGGGGSASYLSDLLDLSETITDKPSGGGYGLVYSTSATDKNGNSGAWIYVAPGTAANISGANTTARLWSGSVIKSAIEAYGYVTSSGVTSVATGIGLTGGTITNTGTLKVKLKNETLNTADSAKSTSTNGGLYSIEADKSGNLAVRVPWVNTWNAASTSQAGYVPKLALASTATIATQSTEYVLTYISGTETAPVWRKLPANAFNNNTYTNGTGISLSGNTFSLNVAGAKTALGLGTMAYETASNYLTTTTAASTYVKLSPGTSEQTISSSISSLVKGVINLWRSSGDHYTFLGFSNGTTETYLGGIGFKSQSDHNLYHKDGSSYYTIFDENNYTSYVNTTNFPGLNKTGTVTKVSTGTGLTGGDITTTGTISINSTYQGYITHGESAYNSLGNYVLKAGDTMTGGLAICLTPSSSYPVDRTKATLIVEDDSAAATGEIQGGNIIISRGYTATANQSAGAITFYGRRLSGGYRNGARIASIASVVGTSYDRQDLVFYTSNNTNDSSPAFEETMRIRADKAVSMTGSLSVSRGGVYNIYTNNTASDGTATGIRFQLNGTTKGGLFVSSDENLYYSVGTATTGNRVLTSANYDSFALPLSAGSSYPLTGHLYLNEGLGIQAVGGVGLLVYHPTPGWSGIDSTQWGLGSVNSQGVIRSSNSNLLHYKGSTSYSIWDASNSGISTMPWACSTLSVNTSLTLPNDVSILGTLTDSTTASMIKMSTSNNIVVGSSSFAHNVNLYGTLVKFYAGGTTAIGTVSSTGLDVTGTVTASGIGTFDRVVLSNSGAVSHIEFTRAGWNYVSVPTDGVIAFNVGGSGSANTSMAVTPDGICAGTKGVHSCGLPTAYWGSIYGKDLYLGGDTHNTAAGSIIFSEKLDAQRNGFKIAPVHATSANRVNLVFYRSNNGNSPWAASWTTFMTLSYDGKVTIAGSLTTSGDQTISSDATLKTNWRELNYTVKDIANVKIGIFAWKDGHGTSAGSIAQDWKKLVPELVHGEEGNMTLAYGQIALLNTVMLARRSEDHETRIKALEAENAKLKEEIKRLKS